MLPRILLIMMALLVFAPNPLPAAQKEKKMAYVVAPFAPVLRERRPESELLVQGVRVCGNLSPVAAKCREGTD